MSFVRVRFELFSCQLTIRLQQYKNNSTPLNMNYQKALLVIPTKERVGTFPTLVVIIVTALIFWLSF